MDTVKRFTEGQPLTCDDLPIVPTESVIRGIHKTGTIDINVDHSLTLEEFDGTSIGIKSAWHSEGWHSAKLLTLPDWYKAETEQLKASGNLTEKKLAQSAEEQAAEPQNDGQNSEKTSDIQREAAWALLKVRAANLRSATTSDCGDIDSANVIADECRKYIEVYEYAESIGALD